MYLLSALVYSNHFAQAKRVQAEKENAQYSASLNATKVATFNAVPSPTANPVTAQAPFISYVSFPCVVSFCLFRDGFQKLKSGTGFDRCNAAKSRQRQAGWQRAVAAARSVAVARTSSRAWSSSRPCCIATQQRHADGLTYGIQCSSDSSCNISVLPANASTSSNAGTRTGNSDCSSTSSRTSTGSSSGSSSGSSTGTSIPSNADADPSASSSTSTGSETFHCGDWQSPATDASRSACPPQ
jgi:hypothetical protein